MFIPSEISMAQHLRQLENGDRGSKNGENMIKIHRLFYSKIHFLYCSIYKKKKEQNKIKNREVKIRTLDLLICSPMRPQVDSTAMYVLIY